MYEKPTLNEAGNATDIILGVTSWGDDLDGLVVIAGTEFAEDSHFDD